MANSVAKRRTEKTAEIVAPAWALARADGIAKAVVACAEPAGQGPTAGRVIALVPGMADDDRIAHLLPPAGRPHPRPMRYPYNTPLD